MADFEHTVTKLSSHNVSIGDGLARTMSITIEMETETTVDEELVRKTWKFTLPSILHDELRHLTRQFNREICSDRRAAELTGSGDFTVPLIE